MKKRQPTILLLIFSLLVPTLWAQENKEVRPTQFALTANYGSMHFTDTYLSPYRYKGWNVGLSGERLRFYKGNDRLLGIQTLNLEFSRSTYGRQGFGLCYEAQIDYSYGTLYRLYSDDRFNLLAGGSVSVLAGGGYNQRNSNNPGNAKLSVDLNAALLASYRLKIKEYPITIRYTLSLPVMGTFFSPEYGQSYYEMFILGNTSGMMHFGSWHNRQAMRNLITVDLPLGNGAFRIGYLNYFNRMAVHQLVSYSMINNIVIGYVAEFNLFPAKKRTLLYNKTDL